MTETDKLDDPVEPTPNAPAPAMPKRQRSGLVGPVIGGVIAAAAGFGVAQYVPGGWPIADTSALQQQLAAQEAKIAALKAQIAETPAAATDPALLDRVAALETALATAPATPDLSGLTSRLAAAEARLTSIEAMPADGTASAPALTAAITDLRAQIAALKAAPALPAEVAAATAAVEAKLAEVVAQAAAMKADALATAQSIATHAALRQLQSALESGSPYGSALADLPADKIPAVLAENAITGLPTLNQLKDSFPEAARLALEASLRANMGSSWTERVTAFLRNQTGARSLSPREGTDPDAVLSRAEAALGKGDLTAALAELAGLPPEGQAAMADWQALATKRQTGAEAVASLGQALGG